MDTFESRSATSTAYELAEGPIWDSRSMTLHWVDIPLGAVVRGRFAGDRINEIDRTAFGETVGAVGLAVDGGLIVAAERGLATIDHLGDIHRGPALLVDGVDSRMNDGACDPAGRFIVGSLARGKRTDREVLLSAEPSGPVTVLRKDVSLSNGVAWAPDGRTIYHVDTLPGRIWAANYDCDSGNASSWRVLFSVTDGSPDGLVVDTEGMLWIAIWGAGEVRRYDSAGVLLAVVTVDTPFVSCPAFAGPNLDTLVITTARVGFTDSSVAPPLAGLLFVAHPGVSGLPENCWAGDSTRPQWATVD